MAQRGTSCIVLCMGAQWGMFAHVILPSTSHRYITQIKHSHTAMGGSMIQAVSISVYLTIDRTMTTDTKHFATRILVKSWDTKNNPPGGINKFQSESFV